jgi:hypothetical protein
VLLEVGRALLFSASCARQSAQSRLRLFNFSPDEIVERGELLRHTTIQTKKPPHGRLFCLSGGACAARTRDHLIKSLGFAVLLSLTNINKYKQNNELMILWLNGS